MLAITVDVIHDICPQRETEGCNEILFCALFSAFGRSMNIVSNIYNYFIAYHPIFILLCYIFAYFLLSTYVFNLGKVLSKMNKLFNDENQMQ